MPQDFWRLPETREALTRLDMAAIVALLRRHSDLTLKAIARLTGLSDGMVSMLESGRSQLRDLVKIRAALQALEAPPLAPQPLPAPRPEEGPLLQTERTPRSATAPEISPDDWPAGLDTVRTWAPWNDIFSTSTTTEERQFAEIAFRWLVTPPDTTVAHSAGAHVGDSDVQRLRAVGRQLKTLDNTYGGGTAFPLLATFLCHEVAPLLNGSYDEAVGRSLMRTTAELALDTGWAAYDQGEHLQARGYMVYALRLSHAGDDRLFGGRVLAALSHQALHLGQVPVAIDMARAARTGTQAISTAKMTAMLAAMEACAHAAHADRPSCLHALSTAETALAAAKSDDAPSWLDFDEGGLWGHAARAFRDLGEPTTAQRYAENAVRSCHIDHGRTRAQRTAILANAHLQHGDVEQAAALGTRIVNQAHGLRSHHVRQDIATLARDIQVAGAATIVEVDTFLRQAKPVLVSSDGVSASSG
ncbi:helix-turn-helix domain-containing protein [Salinactinospora qingdaonensis]|uniref:helix-turn-helix domain-containing protein n=1 Tax=Salinactinospora qingdaonensis TaxID=702744 RepID=UPI0031E8467A